MSNPEKERAPCEMGFGKVLKFKREGDKVELYDSTPNGCGYVGKGVTGEDATILVGITHFSGPRGSMREFMRETRRIGIGFWNGLEHLECCIHTAEGKDVLADNAGIARKELKPTK